MKTKLLGVVAALALLPTCASLISPASAATITWSVSVLMQQNGTASGSFTIDTSTQAVSNVDITTTPGEQSWPYTTHYGCSSCTFFIDYILYTPTFISFNNSALGADIEFYLSSGSLFTAAQSIDVYVMESHENSQLRDGHGTISAPVPAPVVPLPGALLLFATGLGALGLLGWRRKRKQAA